MNRRKFLALLGGLSFVVLKPLGLFGKEDCVRDCKDCKRDYECCKIYPIPVTEKEKRELEKEARRLKLKIEYIGEDYIKPPCAFFNNETSKCRIHGKKEPKVCRLYYCDDWCVDAIPVPDSLRLR